ncbi:hydroxymethylglutaryl-CoA lyase [Halalkalibacter nanhaiisediminis]|uniref:Hydroxymethylglutaryl-CoA lyase n=1 Tax=Halalkalibacter nanhaiisediminis TaxID=688079 RepID=A0A562QDB3_9BACI|nr:hydroxymethylglutaryl-CoA lyase [Halalkalibacter nanhaiisediminis]TWI54738.1 hydroxymethylglutaryl-CoA lyase [Halalkalibacter nanhaiisediminis]
MNWPQSVNINEVVLRDGLQLEQKLLTTDEKKIIAMELLKANVKTIEFGSFVHPTLVPQMANSGELYNKLNDTNRITLIALIPNLKGAETAAIFGVKQLNIVFSASNTHNLQNIRQTTEQSLENFRIIKEFCDQNGMKLDVSIATTFGCPFEGEVSVSQIHLIVKQVINAGANVVTLADTTGMANPRQVYELSSSLLDQFPEQTFNLHFHNTRDMGLTNILAGVQAGIRSFDTALGGLGGCPFAPGATGNVCTEDVVHMLHSMGIDTGIDLDQLIETASILERLIGHELPSCILKAGKFDRKYPIPS